MISTWHSKGTPKPANLHQLDYVDEEVLGLTYSEFFCVHRTRKCIQHIQCLWDVLSFLNCLWKILFRYVSLGMRLRKIPWTKEAFMGSHIKITGGDHLVKPNLVPASKLLCLSMLYDSSAT